MAISRDDSSDVLKIICTMASARPWHRLAFAEVRPELAACGLGETQLMAALNELVACDEIMTDREPGPDTLDGLLTVQPTDAGFERYATGCVDGWEQASDRVAAAIVDGHDTLSAIAESTGLAIGLAHHVLIQLESAGDVTVSRGPGGVRVTDVAAPYAEEHAAAAE